MGTSCVNKKAKLIPTIYNSQNLVEQKEIKLSLNNNNNLYSIDYNLNEIKKIKSTFKSFFSLSPPNISSFDKRMKKP